MKCQKFRIIEQVRKRRFRTKAQLQIMENAFILLILFIIFSIAFVIAVQKSNQKDKLAEYSQVELIKKSRVLNFFPEMQCTDNNNLKSDCYDILKVMSFSDKVRQDSFYYKPLLGNIKISIRRYEPSPENKGWGTEWVVYDSQKPGATDKVAVRFPVLLRNVTDNSDYFGVIFLEVYG